MIEYPWHGGLACTASNLHPFAARYPSASAWMNSYGYRGCGAMSTPTISSKPTSEYPLGHPASTAEEVKELHA